jgi:hypothetical protein
MDGTSHKGPTTFAKAAPEPAPNTTVAVAIATSNWVPELMKAIVTTSLWLNFRSQAIT